MGNKATTQNFYDDIRNNLTEFQDSELYKIISTKDGGHLVELMREALRSNNDFRKVDGYIKAELAHFFYNNGEGQNVGSHSLFYLILITIDMFFLFLNRSLSSKL